MPHRAKGYWIVRVHVTDLAAYPAYIEAARPVFERYAARFLVRGGRARTVETGAISTDADPGERPGPATRHVIIEFDSYHQALACYRDPAYQEAARLRWASASTDLIIAEGTASSSDGA